MNVLTAFLLGIFTAIIIISIFYVLNLFYNDKVGKVYEKVFCSNI